MVSQGTTVSLIILYSERSKSTLLQYSANLILLEGYNFVVHFSLANDMLSIDVACLDLRAVIILLHKRLVF